MRVGIYNRWLATLGGGEKHSLAIAETLSQEHQVEVITHTPVQKSLVEERLNLDLSRVAFVTLPDRASIEMAPVSADYDLFVNASYMDFFPCFAKKGMTLVYFPLKFNRRIALKRQIKLYARRWFKLPAIMAGFHAFHYDRDSFRWTTDRIISVQLPASSTEYHVQFAVSSQDKNIRDATILLGDQPIEKVVFSEVNQPVSCRISAPARLPEENLKMTIVADGEILADGKPKMELSDYSSDLPQYRIYRFLFERLFRGVGIRLQYYPLGTTILDYIDSYDVILANSEYTRRWIQKYWHRDSQVLYPAVEVESYHPAEKQNTILNVGRFFAGSHNKKHLEMIRAFKRMVDNGLTGWELHMAGSTTPGKEHEAYLEEVTREAQNYPIRFHINMPYKDLVDLYEKSAIYWHASGYGENEKEDPEKFEHFGITTVEAMAAGCVPVVIRKGGQPEIVSHEQNGLLWDTLEELQKQTLRVIHDDPFRHKLAAAAKIASSQYDKEHFRQKISDLLKQIDS